MSGVNLSCSLNVTGSYSRKPITCCILPAWLNWTKIFDIFKPVYLILPLWRHLNLHLVNDRRLRNENSSLIGAYDHLYSLYFWAEMTTPRAVSCELKFPKLWISQQRGLMFVMFVSACTMNFTASRCVYDQTLGYVQAVCHMFVYINQLWVKRAYL